MGIVKLYYPKYVITKIKLFMGHPFLRQAPWLPHSMPEKEVDASIQKPLKFAQRILLLYTMK